MPAYKLTYFSTRGRAEITRLIFAQAGVEYEDIRFKKAEWPNFKPTMEFGQAPMLEVDGQKLGQSIAIARYLAKQFNLAGKTPMEQAQADAIVDVFSDLIVALFTMFMAPNDEVKNENKGKVVSKLEGLEAYLIKQNGGNGYFVGDSVTWADLDAFQWISTLKEHKPEILKDFPKISAHCDRIAALPNIKTWLEKRPVQVGMMPE